MIQQPGLARPSCSSIGSLHPTWDDPKMDQSMPDEHKPQHDECDTPDCLFHIFASLSSGMGLAFCNAIPFSPGYSSHPILQAIDVDATHRNMRHKVNAHRSLWIERGECKIWRLIWQIDKVAQFLLHGFPHLRSLMDISSTCDRTPLQG